MSSYFIESFKIEKLWGYRPINLTFHRKMNILIGTNGSGKTTVLNLLHSILKADLRNLLDVNFDLIEVKLRNFKGKSACTVTVKREGADGLPEISLDNDILSLKTDAVSERRLSPERYLFPERGSYARSTFIQTAAGGDVDIIIKAEKFYDKLTALVPIVWLPVSRRLPIPQDEEEQYTRRETLESVDLRLKELLAGLSRYRSELNAQLSKRYRDFENQVLSVMLYSKEHDHLDSIRSSIPSSLPTETEKNQLREAFKDAGLLKSKQMRTRIDDHFAEAEKAGKRISENVRLELEDILVLPLISRTKSMVKYARELEKYRNDIFAPLRLYKNIVDSFLEDKTIAVGEDGRLQIKLSSPSELDWRDLSSGEKQILILLTQALLRLDNPVIYMADEPELSLHVTWQEKLLESLVALGGQKQIIVATHSPDIVGQFRDNVITLGKES